jgi:hypothetical protein
MATHVWEQVGRAWHTQTILDIRKTEPGHDDGMAQDHGASKAFSHNILLVY